MGLANSIDPDEAAHYEPPYQELCCLPSSKLEMLRSDCTRAQAGVIWHSRQFPLILNQFYGDSLHNVICSCNNEV